METVTLNMFDADGNSQPVKAQARVIGDFALHREINLDGSEKRPKRWRITHIPTGASIMSALPYVSGKPREGTAPMKAYLDWMREVQETPEFRNWQAVMADASFGLIHPSKLGGRAVDASRLFAAKARTIDAMFRDW